MSCGLQQGAPTRAPNRPGGSNFRGSYLLSRRILDGVSVQTGEKCYTQAIGRGRRPITGSGGKVVHEAAESPTPDSRSVSR